MQADPSAALPLALWSQLLAGVALGLAWARAGRGAPPGLCRRVPFVVLVGWNVVENITRLLPNVL